VLLTVPFMHRYGWDRDELYFLAAAKHPALGYVDFPPVTAWIGWGVVHTIGTSLFWLRMSGQIASVAGVVVVALIARDLGGGRIAQVVAAAAWASTPVALASASIYHPTIYDIPIWIAVSWVALRLLQGGGIGWWVALGVLSGLGIETKYTIAVFLVALVAALALSPQRRLLLGRGPLVAFGLAVLLTIPNLVWEAQHDWASVRFYPSQQAKTAGDTSHLAYVGDGILFMGGMTLVAAFGIVWLWRRGLRPLAIAPLIVLVVYFVSQGRAYYPLPALALPVAAGVVSVSQWVVAGRRRRWVPVSGVALLHLLVLAVVLPVVVPVLSTASMIHRGIWNQSFYKDEIGWHEMTAEALRGWHEMPASARANAVLLAHNYGEAGAMAYFGAGHGLPPVVSGHLSWQYWGPRTQTSALTIGYDQSNAGGVCVRWHPLVRITNVWHIANEEQGRWVGWCRLVAPLGQIWQRRIASDTL
jgi:4-amino-4-deoxy-L-arabinose transferase-like glycosyltransferase